MVVFLFCLTSKAYLSRCCIDIASKTHEEFEDTTVKVLDFKRARIYYKQLKRLQIYNEKGILIYIVV